MNKPKITLLYFRSVAPLLIFIYLFNEFSFLFAFFRTVNVFPWTHLIQSLTIAVSGFILLAVPAFVFSGRLEKILSADDTVPDDLKLMVFIKCMKGLSLTVCLTIFMMLVVPRLTGLFFIQKEYTSSIFISNFLTKSISLFIELYPLLCFDTKIIPPQPPIFNYQCSKRSIRN